jgi:hypothetical protein
VWSDFVKPAPAASAEASTNAVKSFPARIAGRTRLNIQDCLYGPLVAVCVEADRHTIAFPTVRFDAGEYKEAVECPKLSQGERDFAA